MNKTILGAVACLLAASVSGCSAEMDSEGVEVLDQGLQGPQNFTIKVKSPDFKKGKAFADANTCAGKGFQEGASPELYWSQGPVGTQTYAIVLRDTSIEDPNFSYHWAAWNIPVDIRHLPSIPGLESPDAPLPESMGGAQHAHPRGDDETGAWNQRFFAPCPSWEAYCSGDESLQVTDSYEFRVYALPSDYDAPPYDSKVHPNFVYRLAQAFEGMDLNAEPAILTATSDAIPSSVFFCTPPEE